MNALCPRGERTILWPGIVLVLAACAAQLPQGEALMASGRWDEAVTFYLEAVRRNPTDPEARTGLLRSLSEGSLHAQRQGDALERAGHLEEAKARYERALAYHSENVAGPGAPPPPRGPPHARRGGG